MVDSTYSLLTGSGRENVIQVEENVEEEEEEDEERQRRPKGIDQKNCAKPC